MLIVTLFFVLIQFALSLVSPRRFIILSLWVQCIPYWWNFDVDTTFQTPVGRLSVVALQQFGLLFACLFVIFPNLDQTTPEMRRCKWHLIFIGFCLLSLSYSSSVMFGLRMIAKLLTPLLFMLATFSALTSQQDLRASHRAIIGSGVVILALALLAKASGINSDPNIAVTGLAGLGPPGMGPPVFSAHMLPVAMLALASYVREPRLATLLLVSVFALAILAALQRTSAAALFFGFSAILFLGTRGIWRALLPTAGGIGFISLLVFSGPFRRRMFFENVSSAQLLANPAAALDQINGSGRFTLWDFVLKKFFDPDPMFGSGLGATQAYFSEFGRPAVVHSEYVRMLCEVGFVGLVLFAIAVMSYFLNLRRTKDPSNAILIDTAALAAIGGLTSYVIFFSTDNGLDYTSQFGIYVFALIAISEKSRHLSLNVAHAAKSDVDLGERLFPNLMD